MMTTYDWLDAQIVAATRFARTSNLDFEWQQMPRASEKDIRQCEKLIGVRLSASHRAFLLRCNGASAVHSIGNGAEGLGNTVFVLGSDEIVQQFVRMRDDFDRPEDRELSLKDPTRAWLDLIPTLDLQDANYIVSDPHSAVQGEYALRYADHELGPEWWRRTEPIGRSFEDVLRTMFRSFVVRQKFEFWHREIRWR